MLADIEVVAVGESSEHLAERPIERTHRAAGLGKAVRAPRSQVGVEEVLAQVPRRVPTSGEEPARHLGRVVFGLRVSEAEGGGGFRLTDDVTTRSASGLSPSSGTGAAAQQSAAASRRRAVRADNMAGMIPRQG